MLLLANLFYCYLISAFSTSVLIFSAIAASSSAAIGFALFESSSCGPLIGTRCRWTWDTPKPSTTKPTRTELIAQTEANDAYNDGRHSIAIGLDMDEKRWDPDGTAACEEICQPNADQGWIPIDEDFQSGDDAPSGHPRCDCSTDYRKSSE